MNQAYLKHFIEQAIEEDVGSGDHTTLACFPKNAKGSARLIVKKNNAIIAGIETARSIYKIQDPDCQIKTNYKDGSLVRQGDVIFTLAGNIHTILTLERLVLNIMQRMSGVATLTRQYVDAIKGSKTKIIDTRKTCPGMRQLQKEAVQIGGGTNHRMGLYDMIMLKDNHIDYSGGIKPAINQVHDYFKKQNIKLPIVIEARSIEDVKEIIEHGGIDRIMLDNFTPEETKKAIALIDGRYETESSGGINLETVQKYAACGVDYISVGALTHQAKSIDLTLLAEPGGKVRP